MLDRGAKDYGWAMENAAKEGHINIVQMMLELGSRNYERAITRAKRGKYQDIVDLIEVYEGKSENDLN